MEITAPHPITAQDVVEYRVPRDANISPDGQFIVYTLLHAAKRTTSERACEIWLADTSTAQSHRLTFGRGTDQMPRWSPDSQHIVFSSNRRNGNDLYITPINTGFNEDAAVLFIANAFAV